MDSDERHKWNRDERAILQCLDGLLREKSVAEAIDQIAARLLARTPAGSQKLMDREPVPLAVYGERLPSTVRSSWVFLMRAPAVTGAERHPNSHQRSVAYRGTGFFEVSDSPQFDGEGEGASLLLTGGFETPLETRWISIAASVWHQAVVPEGEWIVVSFHTATENELKEERPEPAQINPEDGYEGE